jgi:hypothetical protein
MNQCQQPEIASERADAANLKRTVRPRADRKEDVMQYRTLEQTREVAVVHAAFRRTMSREDRLERWAEVLERRGGLIQALPATEFVPWRERRQMRADGSALSVALTDPVLRAAGLSGDRYEDGVAFFGLCDEEAHLIMCSCYAGETPSAMEVAARVRYTAAAPRILALNLGLLPVAVVGALFASVLAAAF